MSATKEYTLEIYKTDRRTKEGRRLIAKQEFAPVTNAYIKAVADGKRNLGFDVEIFETWITKKNLLSGKEYQEKYYTPHF